MLLSSWHWHPHCNGVAVVDAQVSLQSRQLCHHCNNIVALVVMALLPLSTGVIALVTMASSPLLMCRCLCHCHDGVVALIALAPLPTLHRHCCPYCTAVILLIALASLLSRCMGIDNIIALALLPPLGWCVCAIALELLPLSHWHCHPWYAVICVLVMQASLP